MVNKATPDGRKINQLISEILGPSELPTLKANIRELRSRAEGADDMLGWVIRNSFRDAVVKRDAAYQRRMQGYRHNAVIVQPEQALAAMIPGFVPMGGSHQDFIDGLARFIQRCEMLLDPITPAITEAEIKATVSAAQRAFGMIGIIAPGHPLRVFRFNHSHISHNSECAILDGDSRQSFMFLYHPRDCDIHDRVFIFAHELGHALHYALTGDVDIVPDGYDSLNKRLGVKIEEQKDKQEGFADAVAIAILGSPNSRLKSHLPTQFSKAISPMFVRYVKGLCDAARPSR